MWDRWEDGKYEWKKRCFFFKQARNTQIVSLSIYTFLSVGTINDSAFVDYTTGKHFSFFCCTTPSYIYIYLHLLAFSTLSTFALTTSFLRYSSTLSLHHYQVRGSTFYCDAKPKNIVSSYKTPFSFSSRARTPNGRGKYLRDKRNNAFSFSNFYWCKYW